MLDVAWPEIVVIGLVALVAIGPKDLPKVMYNLGRFAGKVRKYGRDIRATLEELSYEAEAADRAQKQKAEQKSDTPKS